MPEDKSDEILKVLQELHTKNSDFEACMVVKRGLEGVVVFPEDFIEQVSSIWEPLKETIDVVLEMISDKASWGLEKNYVEMLDYGITFCVIGMSDTALVTFTRRSEEEETLKKIAANLPDIKAAREHIEAIAEA